MVLFEHWSNTAIVHVLKFYMQQPVLNLKICVLSVHTLSFQYRIELSVISTIQYSNFSLNLQFLNS